MALMHERSPIAPKSLGLEWDAEWARTLANDSMAALAQLSASLEAAFAEMSESLEAARKFVQADSDTLVQIQRQLRRCQLCETAGWLPHYTTPFSLIEE